MSDRFKFRVFLKYNQIMCDTDSYCFLQGLNKCVFHFTNGGQKTLKNDDFILMQCTGLKDKNGELIYEGDIINDKSNHIRVVVWEQDCFKYPALKTSRYFHRPISNQLEKRRIGLRGKLTFQDAIGKCDKKHFEVIGNIYENSELLEDK